MPNTFVVLWDQMEFWFQKKPSGFYKFLKPCQHRWYKPGDSWCEQLKISENTFRKYQDFLCTSYASKTLFDEQSDPFQGKPYACYFDRLRKITVYFRNHSLADQLTREKILNLNCASVCVWNNTDFNKNIKYPPKSPLKAKADREGGRLIQKNYKKNNLTPLSPSLNDVAEKMREIWVEATKDHIRTPKLSGHFAQKLLEALKTFFQNSLERWKAYCKKISSSDFLMGKRGTFQAWLIWVIREDTIHKVRAGGYGLPAEEQEPEHGITNFAEKAQELIHKQIRPVKAKDNLLKRLTELKERVGAASYISWFSDCVIKQDGDGTWLDFTHMGGFQREYVREKFSDVLKELQL